MGEKKLLFEKNAIALEGEWFVLGGCPFHRLLYSWVWTIYWWSTGHVSGRIMDCLFKIWYTREYYCTKNCEIYLCFKIIQSYLVATLLNNSLIPIRNWPSLVLSFTSVMEKRGIERAQGSRDTLLGPARSWQLRSNQTAQFSICIQIESQIYLFWIE